MEEQVKFQMPRIADTELEKVDFYLAKKTIEVAEPAAG